MSEPVELILPALREELAKLRVGDEVLLSGCVYTMRDAATSARSRRCMRQASCPATWRGDAFLRRAPRRLRRTTLGSVGPTTASRMDFATPEPHGRGNHGVHRQGKALDGRGRGLRGNGQRVLATVGGIARCSRPTWRKASS